MTEFSFNIWTTLLSLAILNGVLISIYLVVTARMSKNSNRILFLFILCVMLISFENLIEYGTAFVGFPHLMYSTVPLMFCLGPLLYLYHQDRFDHLPDNKIILLHFLPALIVLLYMLQFYLLPAERKLWYFNSLHTAGERVIGPRHLLVALIFQLQLIAYIFFSLSRMSAFNKRIKVESADSVIEQFRSVESIFIIFILVFVFSFVSQIALFYESDFFETADRIESLSISFLIHGILFSLIALSNKSLPVVSLERKEKSEVLDEQSEIVKDKILNLMQSKKLFLNPNLKLEDIANEVDESKSKVSTLINSQLASNFYDFVNSYRINFAIELLESEKSKNISLDSIALESGFNNYISFYRVFKRITKKSPSEYLK